MPSGKKPAEPTLQNEGSVSTIFCGVETVQWRPSW